MRILQTHVDYIKYKPVEKEIQIAESVEKKETEIKDILVIFVSVEKDDDVEVGKRAVNEIKDFLGKLKSNKILIYPFAHLSNDLAKPQEALNIVKEMESYSKELKIETYRAPFGWNKALEMKVKGHPLAEQSRVILPVGEKEVKEKEVVSRALENEQKLKAEWFVILPNGNLIPVNKFDFSGHRNLEKFANYEIAKSRVVQQMPPHVTLMKKLEIADNEPGSDSGNLRFYPKGRLIKSLIETFVTEKVIDYGGMEVETPLMYDFEHPSLASYLNRFPARQYVVKSDDKEFFLRFSACFGQFLMAKDSQISYRQMPFKIYELTRYSFRREKSGELVGLRRLRAFTMPDVHSFCVDMNQAMEESKIRFELSQETLREIGIDKDDYELGIRFTKDFYEENKPYIKSLIKLHSKPVLVEMWNDKFFYFVLKWEFNFVDNLDKAAALSTDQIDVENGERYNITFVDKDGKKKHPLILHCSPSGAIERVIYALLEKAYRDQQNKKVPMFPLWLAPTQVRLIPIADKFKKNLEKIADELEENQIRVDIDDRNDTLQKKIRDAELEWIPYIVVIGEREIKSKKLSVRNRKRGETEKVVLKKLIVEIRKQTEKMPFKKLPLPKILSKRPVFVG